MRNEPGNLARIVHILEAISEIESYISGTSFPEFIENSMMRFATIKQLEIIGEASNHVSNDIQERFPGVSWGEIIGFRNIMIHEYFGVDLEMVWDVVLTELPALKKQIQEIHKSLASF